MERRHVTSPLKGPHGEHAEVMVAIGEDGKLRRVNFWDLDKTLVWAEEIHGPAVEELFSEVEDREELRHVYFAGFRLGNSYREWDRMIKIYHEGQAQHKDPSVYKAEFIDNHQNRALIDEPGHQENLHERANDTLQRFGAIAFRVTSERYEHDPEFFQSEKFLNGPVYHLLRAKAHMGEVNMFMTANQKDFASALVRYSGLWKYGLGLATDETMAGGAKEIAIIKLIEELKQMGLEAADDRLVVIGDSISGDLGSGLKVSQGDKDKKFAGILIVKDSDELRAFKNRLAKTPTDENEANELAQTNAILKGVDVTAVASDSVRKTKSGRYKLGRIGSKKNKS